MSHPVISLGQEDKFLLSETVYKELTVIQELLQKDDFNMAEEKLQKILSRTENNLYEKAVINQMLGHVYSVTGQYIKALAAFVLAEKDNTLPDKVQHDLHYYIGQLLIQSGENEKGIEYLETWFENEANPDDDARLLVSSAYYQVNDFKKIIPHMQAVIHSKNKPEENSYKLLLSAFYNLKNYNDAASLLEKMIVHFPDENNYWLQLASIYQQINNNKKAIAILEFALEKKILGNQEIYQLANLYLIQNIPLKAANLLTEQTAFGNIERTPETLELLANSWLLSREMENAVQVMSELATLTQKPSDFSRLGQMYFEIENWEKALEALQAAVKDKNIDNRADILLMLGISAYRMNDKGLSAAVFNQAMQYDKSREIAAWWLNKINSGT